MRTLAGKPIPEKVQGALVKRFGNEFTKDDILLWSIEVLDLAIEYRLIKGLGYPTAEPGVTIEGREL